MRYYDTVLLWHCSPEPYTPPVLSKNQVTGILENFYEPYAKSSATDTFPVPRAEFDINKLFEARFISKPKHLFICIDSTIPYLPRNLKNIAEKVFICLGDSHHLKNPISRLRIYIKSEDVDGIIFTNNIRHAHWFRDITHATFYFEPALTAKIFSNEKLLDGYRSQDIVLYGQIGNFHPRRSRLAPQLIRDNIIKYINGVDSLIIQELHANIACLNITLNSDLNNRIFEIAQTGALLIIDQIADTNGSGTILKPGVNCLTFANYNELEKLLKDKNRLSSMQKILGMNLYNEYHSYWSLSNIIRRLNTPLNDKFTSLNTYRDTRYTNIDLSFTLSVQKRLIIYEHLLELHRIFENISLFIDSPYKNIIDLDLNDLPRIKIVSKIEELDNINSTCVHIKKESTWSDHVIIVTNRIM